MKIRDNVEIEVSITVRERTTPYTEVMLAKAVRSSAGSLRMDQILNAVGAWTDDCLAQVRDTLEDVGERDR